MSVTQKLKQFHDNYLSAKTMISTAEQSPKKTLPYLPNFRRIFPNSGLERYRESTKTEQGVLESMFCGQRCGSDRNCYDACSQYFNSALEDGHDFIRRVQKDYKVPQIEDE